MSNGVNLITADGSNELTRGFRVHPETGLLVFIGSSELRIDLDTTTADSSHTMSGQSIDGEPGLQGLDSHAASLHTGAFTKLDFGDFLNDDDAEFERIFQQVGGALTAFPNASDSDQQTYLDGNMPTGNQSIEGELIAESANTSLGDENGAGGSDDLATSAVISNAANSPYLAEQTTFESTPDSSLHDDLAMNANTAALSAAQAVTPDSATTSQVVAGLTTDAHTFDDLPGGALQFLYTPRRKVAPTNGEFDEYTQSKPLWVQKLKEAFVSIEDLPPPSQWGIDESTRSIMNIKSEADIKARIQAGDADKRVSTICEVLFDSFIKLYTTGDHFDPNAMPNKSDSSTMDDHWTPKKRMSLYLQGLRESKTLAGNLLLGQDTIAVYTAKPEGRRNAIYGSAKSNAIKAIKAAKLKNLELAAAASENATTAISSTATAGSSAASAGASLGSSQVAQVDGASTATQPISQPPLSTKGKAKGKGTGKKRGKYKTKNILAAINANNALGQDTMPVAEASGDASSLDQWNILQPAGFEPSKKRPASSQDSSTGGEQDVKQSNKRSRKAA